MKSPSDNLDDLVDDDVDDECPNCGGTGVVDACFEDTCVCVDPPCIETRCGWCGGKP